ncbi:PTS fructose transporter subunit IIC [Photobacterium damselae subsp. piscicida]|uniref:protein-N(pi)-phosphohistidine--D-fructose phosphotransferase n=3 Tax=Photobacterium damselae TaxID=38293 RepID=A0A1Q9H3S7_PHODP|nr:fructose-specific PTS transporter subunit EIIC [Photobacterium damselae]MBE8128650.1 PTS sugar transporter subunit IIA [Photobacterium damselae subsp. piscicida]MCG9780657.1 fructose-specific PTS transporter subunit EIIC [Photobacterium damselae]NVH51090.1 PTS sugar transporter subunit IIA [Photobacterium damselae subsp. damselae]NVO79728.1 PTS sugar transporter subunit IIA [Photobacterium damselae subsp. damselae]OLQ82427.1 PTS fructose transporter subunit IIC [Photobacterium damselae subs
MITTLINEKLINLDLQATTKDQVFAEMAEMLTQQGKVADKEQFIADIYAREELGNTGFEEGVALPHAKSAAVASPAVAIGVSRQGIEYGAEDGLPSKLFFMIASPDGGANHHIEVLAELSSKLIEDGFIDAFLAAKTPEEALNLLLADKKEVVAVEQNKGLIIGVTGCPAGVAHTYLAAEALEKAGAELGYEVKVETNGSIGVKNSPTAEEIARAEAIVVSCDKQVDMARFAGKKLIKTGVKAPIKDGKGLIQQALVAKPFEADGDDTSDSSESKVAQTRSNLYRYLMNGVSHMIPFVVTGGLLIALSLAIGGQPTDAGMQIPAGSMWQKVLDVGVVAFQLMIPILAGYIAFAIGDRPALAPGFIGGWIANTGSFYDASAGTGFIGAIVAGLLVGYFVRWVATRNYHKMVQPLVPILIAPITGTLFIAGLFIFVIGAPIASLMDNMNAMLTEMSTGNVVLLGIVLGGMAGFDMGGPFNKVAFLFSVGMIASGQTQFMGAMACAIPVAPLGMGIATVIGRKLNIFEDSEIEAGKAAGAMGLVGISEGAIPFAAQDPLSVIPANVIGSMVAAVMAFSFGITNSVAHGGPVVALLGAMNKPVLALICMATGAVVTALVAVSLKKYRKAKAERELAAA